MRKAIKKIAMLFMVCGLAISVSFGFDYKNYSYYKELKAWIEDMKIKYPHLKADNPETIKEYGEYPRLTPFINDLEFVDDLDVELKKEENKGKNEKQIMRKVANSPKWNGADRGKYETHYYDSMASGSRLLRLALKEAKEAEEKIKYNKDLADAKAGAFREMGGEMMRKKD